MLTVEAKCVAVLAVQAIRRMRGGAQSQLMLGADGQLWVVKFQNNPQHLRVLANELIAEWLVGHTEEMVIERSSTVVERCVAGLQFGSRFVGGLMPGQVVDYLPVPQ